MRKKFTMLLASLFLITGIAKADFTQEYTKTGEFWTAAGTVYPAELNNTTDAGGGKGNASGHVGVDGHSVYKAEVDVIANGGNITVTFAYVENQGLGKNNHAASFLGVDVLKDGEVVYQDYHLSFVGGTPQRNVYTLTGVEAGNYTLRYFICNQNGNHAINDTGGTITVTGAIQQGLVDLTINYTINGVVKSTTEVEKVSGESYAIPVPTYTKIAACKIGETAQTVTNGACTITVPAETATITVELANNFPFETSTNYGNAVWYVLQIRSNNKKYVVRSASAPYANTTTTPTTEDALWAFVGNPFDGIQVLNKAAGAEQTLGLDGSNGIMTENGKTWNITQGSGGFLLRDGNEGTKYFHDYSSKLQIWDDGRAAGDPGSAFVVTSEAEMISLATSALNAQKALMPIYEEASYYTYSDEALAAANTTLQGVATPTTILAALQVKATAESVQATLDAAGKSGAPAVGDVIQLKNRQYNKYLKANDADLTSIESRSDLATLWVVEEGADGNVKLKNYSTNKYIGEIRESAKVAMVESENAKQFAWTNQAGVYAVFKETTGDGKVYGHIAGHNVLVGWEPSANATQWVVSNVCPLSITYLYNGAEVRTSSAIVEKGTVYTVTSPVDFTKPSACQKGEEDLVAVDGVFSFEVTEATTLTVELTDDLPFEKTELNQDGSFPENTTWYVVKQHSTQGYAWTWKYDETNGVTAEPGLTTGYTDNHLWCFAGSKDDVKIYNKVAGKGYSLTNTNPASMAAENAAVWKMVKSTAEATFAGKNPFCLQNGDVNSYLNAQNNDETGKKELKYWDSRDNGSTIMVIAQQPLSIKYMYKGAELTELSVNRLVDAGTHTVTNPYANKYVNVGCTVNGTRVEAVNGQWTVNVTEPTSVIVTITENLPFKTSTSFATANWQYLQMNSNNWKYMQKNENDNKTSSVNANSLTDRALWAFVGDALNGFQIWNKAVEGAVLTVDNSNDGTAAYMKTSGDQKWTIEKGNGGFILRQGTNECLNDHGGGGVMKIWDHTNSPTGAGSAFRTISSGVKNLSDLYNSKIYVLQAERSQLLYDANASVPSKLSSGMANNIAANGSDGNQQFMIIKPEDNFDGKYYLYNVGAAKFVDANLNFTDYPEPVLSFEENEGNPVFPWFVKIGGKYVVPDANGTAGNKLFHTETPEADAGKWYRIEEVDEDMSLAVSVAQTIQAAEGLVKNASQLSNDKVYAVYTHDRGAWYHNGDDALWSTGKNAKPGDAAENADHFAFLTVNGKIYLYSVGAGKFIVKSETAGSTAHTNMYYATYSDIPTQTVELSPATNGGWFPVVVKLNVEGPNQLSVSNAFSYPVIMYDDLADAGNQVRIEEVGTLNMSAVVAQIEEYQMNDEAKGGLQTLITEATTKNVYLENASLTAAITAAQAALDKVGATYDELMTAKENLAAALNSALYVTEINGFSNNYVYTFVSKRGWMGANESTGVISGTGADDNANYQWAVYKSTREHYYLYNIGKAQFMGVETRNNTQMPFSATPQTTGLTFKESAWADYPIMFSMNNEYVVNNDNNGKMICWTGGWSKLDDEGNNHKVTIVGKIESSTLTTIAAAVELYETQGVAVQALDVAIAAAQAKVESMGEGLGYYSSTDADAAATLAAIVEFKNAITAETTVDDIEAQTAAANALVTTFSVNLPETGKFYRFSYKYGENDVKYVQAIASNAVNPNNANDGKQNAMSMVGGEQGAASIFYYDGGTNSGSIDDDKLLSYSTGLYVRETGGTRGLQAVGAQAGKAQFAAGSEIGKLYIYADDSFHAHNQWGSLFIDHCPNPHNPEHNFTVEEVTTLPVTVSEVGYATLYAPVALNIPADVTIYVGVKEDNYLDLTDITTLVNGNVIPANTGVVIKANQGTYNFTVADDVAALDASKNLLTGKYPKSAKDDAKKVYTLQNGDNGVGFYLFKGQDAQGATTYINGFRAWVELDIATPANALRFRMPGTTAIEGSEREVQDAQLIYDLQGRRVLNPTKGMYIVNGKKVVIK